MRCLVVLGCLVLTAVSAPAAEQVELRGAWVWARNCRTQELADALLDRAESAHLNALYVLVFHWGAQAPYASDILPLDPNHANGFDPLAYLVAEGHRRGMEVHAWFGSGQTPANTWVFKEHPDWQVVDVTGQKAGWFDLTNPAVRDWQTRIMIEVLDRYDVDGVHFDYIRFDNRNMPYNEGARQRALADGIDVTPLVSERLPVAAQYLGNPADEPTTARVLARFDHGVPAVAVNDLGQGHVVLFNWNAPRNWPRPVQQALRPALQRLGATVGGEVLVLDSDLTGADPKYGRGMFNTARAWVQNSGFQPKVIKDADLAGLPARSVVVIAGHYRMNDAQARSLLAHVRAGGGALFIDAPVDAVRSSAAARELLGFARLGQFFHAVHVLDVVPGAAQPGEEAILPGGGTAITPAGLDDLIKRWDAWRKAQITRLVEQVATEAKAKHPDKLVTAAVFSSRDNTHAVLQEWPRWVDEGLVDYTIPMSYMNTVEGLETLIQWYRELDPRMERIFPSMSVYSLSRGKSNEDALRIITAQIELCRQQGARGVVLFKLEDMNDEVWRQLGQTVFAEPAHPYRPPARTPR